MYHEAVSEEHSSIYGNLMSKDKRKMFMERSERYLIPSSIYVSCVYIYIYTYIMTTLTNPEGLVITYTNDFLEIILLQLNSSNN